jgi:hypothetical protein
MKIAAAAPRGGGEQSQAVLVGRVRLEAAPPSARHDHAETGSDGTDIAGASRDSELAAWFDSGSPSEINASDWYSPIPARRTIRGLCRPYSNVGKC